MRRDRRALVGALVLLLAACAPRPPILPELTPRGGAAVELTDTVFFPQAEFQCGPAALATVLHSAGVALRPEVLTEQVYVPARQGSLQVELLAATRRAGRIPYVIDPDVAALYAELGAGRPVLVLQNLGLRQLPVWHYAVAVGLDPAADRLVLRSGTEQRRVMSAREFLRTWRLAGSWAMVVLRPGDLPAVAEQARYLRAAALAERYLPPLGRRDAYRAALALWPDSATARFGLGYALHVLGDLDGAEDAYRRVIALEPRHAAAFNNLADVLSARGCDAQARDAAANGLEVARRDYPDLVDVISRTLAEIPAGADAPGCSRSAR